MCLFRNEAYETNLKKRMHGYLSLINKNKIPMNINNN